MGKTMKKSEDYLAGFRDGITNRDRMELHLDFKILGYDIDELIKIVRKHEEAKQELETKANNKYAKTDDHPIFEILYGELLTNSYKIWSDGRIEGFSTYPYRTIVNRIPQQLKQARMEGYSECLLMKSKLEYKPQMTREDAINRHAVSQHNNKEYFNETAAKSAKFVEGLEALGLLKFKS